LQQVLGSDAVKQLAARFNIPVDQLTRVWRSNFPKPRITQVRPASSLVGFEPVKQRFSMAAGPFRPEPPKLQLSH
jgi:hypothetical protein